jgi:lipoprotein-releasing system ATP-binding protein
MKRLKTSASASGDAMIAIGGLRKKFGQLAVLKGITISVARGEIVSIVGPSGAGKSTLLQIVGTLSRPDSGSVVIDGVDVSRLSDSELSAFRNSRIGFVFQFHNLLPEFTAFENICIPGYIGGGDRREVEARAAELIDLLGLTERRNHKPAELSGGEAQRVAIARALINSPAVILADEPSGNLDSRNRDEIHHLFLSLRERFGQTIVVVTHDENLASMADRRIVMTDGLII